MELLNNGRSDHSNWQVIYQKTISATKNARNSVYEKLSSIVYAVCKKCGLSAVQSPEDRHKKLYQFNWNYFISSRFVNACVLHLRFSADNLLFYIEDTSPRWCCRQWWIACKSQKGCFLMKIMNKYEANVSVLSTWWNADSNSFFANFNQSSLSNWTSHLLCPTFYARLTPVPPRPSEKGGQYPTNYALHNVSRNTQSINFMASKNYLWNDECFWNIWLVKYGKLLKWKNCQLQLQFSKARFCETYLSRTLIQALRHSRHIAWFSSSHQIKLCSSSPQTAQSSIPILCRKC